MRVTFEKGKIRVNEFWCLQVGKGEGGKGPGRFKTKTSTPVLTLGVIFHLCMPWNVLHRNGIFAIIAAVGYRFSVAKFLNRIMEGDFLSFFQ